MAKYHRTETSYVNPYNFVSIGGYEGDADHYPVDRKPVTYGALSGVICCTLETLTPLFIPNTTNDKAFSQGEMNSYDFFSYEDLAAIKDMQNHFARPIIPGSSLRGAIRSAYEAVTNSCLSTTDSENVLYRRTPVPRRFHGLIAKEKGEQGKPVRVLYEATKGKLPIEERQKHRMGDEIDGGYYLRGVDIFGKKNDAVMKYKTDENGDKTEIARFDEDGDEWNRFYEVWRLYQQRQGKVKGVNQKKEHDGYRGLLDAEPIPVYYDKLDDGDHYYISPAAITKEVFGKTLMFLLKAQGEHQPCDGKVNNEEVLLCDACRLFGMVSNESSRSSRVSVHDACPKRPEGKSENEWGKNDWSTWYEKPTILPILGGPKVSATEFYMDDVDGAAYFNYDYRVNYYHDIDSEGKSTKKPVRSALDKPKMRGRKFYWHHKDVVKDGTKESLNQRCEVRPVKKGVNFELKISFDRLTEEELQKLLWSLTFGNRNKTHAHKLGHGKPIGYGSVRMGDIKVEISGLDPSTMQIVSEEWALPEDAWAPDEKDVSIREFIKMTDYENAPENVTYPKGEKIKGNSRIPDENSMNWFSINKEYLLGGTNPSFNDVLPKPLDKELGVYGYAQGPGPDAGNRGEIEKAVSQEYDPQEERASKSAVPSMPDEPGETALARALKKAEEPEKAQEEPKAAKTEKVMRNFTKGEAKRASDKIKNKGFILEKDEDVLEELLTVQETDTDFAQLKEYIEWAKKWKADQS